MLMTMYYYIVPCRCSSQSLCTAGWCIDICVGYWRCSFFCGGHARASDRRTGFGMVSHAFLLTAAGQPLFFFQ